MTETAAPADQAERSDSPLQSLERGLAVIEVFSGAQPSLTLSDIARQTAITPATARRILLTLERLGYVRRNGRASRSRPTSCASAPPACPR